MRKIFLSPETYTRLLKRAKSFDDDAETVIARLLDETEGDSSAPGTAKSERVPRGSILPEGEYWLPILQIVAEAGGAAPARDVIQEVGERLHRRLKERDFERLKMGEVRWKNRARFARLRMCEQGLLSDETRGVWQITEAGYHYLEERDRRP